VTTQSSSLVKYFNALTAVSPKEEANTTCFKFNSINLSFANLRTLSVFVAPYFSKYVIFFSFFS